MKNSNHEEMPGLGFFRAGLANLNLIRGDIAGNTQQIKDCISKAVENSVGILILPPLAITGMASGNMSGSDFFMANQNEAVKDIANFLCEECLAEKRDMLVITSIYHRSNHSTNRNCDASSYLSDIKISLRGKAMKDDQADSVSAIRLHEVLPPWEVLSETFSSKESFADYSFIESSALGNFLGSASSTVAIEFFTGEQTVGEFRYLKLQAQAISIRQRCIYLGISQSGSAVIAENGEIRASRSPHSNLPLLIFDCDKQLAANFRSNELKSSHKTQFEHFNIPELDVNLLSREYSKNPFAESKLFDVTENCREILHIQAQALASRLVASNSKTAIIGISGGLDSTLALIVAYEAFKILGRSPSSIITVTMPGFGTTDKTKSNAKIIMDRLGTCSREISIVNAVKSHLADIGHPLDVTDITYENAQARERTQILMDIANDESGIVVGTGDLSESALGWCTFNGDHMSMFSVNASVPKTMIPLILESYISKCSDEALCRAVRSIIETPISPELLPPSSDGDISQRTEDTIGPYILHDFFLYHMVKHGFSPKKILLIAKRAFNDEYDEVFIKKCLKTFISRFFSQQYKRNAAPDSVRIASVDISHEYWKQFSDFSARLWIDEIDEV